MDIQKLEAELLTHYRRISMFTGEPLESVIAKMSKPKLPSISLGLLSPKQFDDIITSLNNDAYTKAYAVQLALIMKLKSSRRYSSSNETVITAGRRVETSVVVTIPMSGEDWDCTRWLETDLKEILSSPVLAKCFTDASTTFTHSLISTLSEITITLDFIN